MSLSIANCNRCPYERRLAHTLRSYVLPIDDFRLSIQQIYAWCFTCHQVVHAEHLESLDELNKQLVQDAEVSDDVYADLTVGPEETAQQARARWVFEQNRRIEWRRLRRTAPRCLECSSTQIAILRGQDQPTSDSLEPDPSIEIEHPDCGGLIEVRSVGFARSRAWLLHTPEGERLQ